MKSVSLLRLMLVGLVCAVAVVGCKKQKPVVTTIPGVTAFPPGPGETPDGPVDPSREPVREPVPSDDAARGRDVPPGGGALGDLEDFGQMLGDRAKFKEQTIYFDFDRAAVRASERPKAEIVAAFLKANPTNKLRIEGHCDERGTEEYNRALGERRALAVREYLVNLGIGPERIITISFGEDRPAVQGHDESAWSKNRRGEFVLLLPKPQ
jgi:peptidoglycan-associated lipoprotein